MSKQYKVVTSGDTISVRADTVGFEDSGVVTFWNSNGTISSNNRDTLVTSFKNWQEVRGPGDES